jgi:ABC-2 type transport system ATP-binding protein
MQQSSIYGSHIVAQKIMKVMEVLMGKPMLEARNLTRRFGSLEAVRNVSFCVLKGEVFSLLGPNGAGKTTTISMLSGLLEPTGGEAEIGGFSIRTHPIQAKRLIGVVPQDLALYDPLTARQNLAFWGQMYGLDGKRLKTSIDEALELVSLTERANERVSTYSGGMKRRLNIAVGLLHRPQLVFMDEPTVGIDPQSRRNILDTVATLKSQGMAVLYTTHYIEEAGELSDRIGIIDHGRLVALGTKKELTRLVGESETIKLRISDGHVYSGDPSPFQNLNGINQAAIVDGQVLLTATDAGVALPKVMIAAHQAGISIRSVEVQEPNLESVFLHLTGRALRD